MAYDDPPDFAWFKGIQLLAKSRIVEQAIGSMCELLHDARGCLGRNRPQMFVQAQKIGRCFAGPLDLHSAGGGSGLSVERLSAHA